MSLFLTFSSAQVRENRLREQSEKQEEIWEISMLDGPKGHNIICWKS